MAGLIMLIILPTCYTTIQHPPIQKHDLGQIKHISNCTEYHQLFYSQVILSDETSGDAWWNYYCKWNWWEGYDLTGFLEEPSFERKDAGYTSSPVDLTYPQSPRRAVDHQIIITTVSSLIKKNTIQRRESVEKRCNKSRLKQQKKQMNPEPIGKAQITEAVDN